MARKVDKLSECVSDKRVTHIVPRPLVDLSEKYFDFDYLENNLVHNAQNVEEEWFNDKRIGKWSDFVKTLTTKDLSSIE